MKSKLISVITLSILMMAVPRGLPSNAAEETIKVPEKIIKLSEEIGAEYNICPELLQSIAFRENSFNSKAVNGTCIGLMQINEPFHQDRMDKLGVTDLYDPEQNMRVAADYLIELFIKHEDPGVVLMIYNGNSKARDFANSKCELSDYADEVLNLSAKLERNHGK